MAETRKQIAFDLDTKALEIYYPSEHWRSSYDIIKRHMQKNGFHWLQGSVYVSDKPLSSARTRAFLETLSKIIPGLICVCGIVAKLILAESTARIIYLTKTQKLSHDEPSQLQETASKLLLVLQV